MTLRSLDLNLLHVFEVIMQHRSVSAAARELGLTASAVSHALARLRRALDDELFVASPSGMEPTRRALELAPDVSEGLARLLSALDTRPFSPAESIRTFNIAATDYPATAWLPMLIASLALKAPHVSLRVFPAGRMDIVRLLDEGRVDMLLGWFDDVPERMRRTTIVTEQETLLVRAGHPLTTGALTRERLAGFPFVVVELTGTENQGQGGFTDERGVMRRNWIERLLIETAENGGRVARVAVTVPTYGPVAPILAATDMVATLPRRLALQAVQSGALAMLDLPYQPLEVNVEAVWNQRADRDPGLQWLVAEIIAVMRAAEGTEPAAEAGEA